MFDNFFKHIDIDPNNVNILDGNAVDLKLECDNYEKKIIAAGGIELFVGKRSGNIKCIFLALHLLDFYHRNFFIPKFKDMYNQKPF